MCFNAEVCFRFIYLKKKIKIGGNSFWDYTIISLLGDNKKIFDHFDSSYDQFSKLSPPLKQFP